MFWELEQTGGLDVVRVLTTVYCIVTFIADLEVPSWSLMLEYAPLQQVPLTVNMLKIPANLPGTCRADKHADSIH